MANSLYDPSLLNMIPSSGWNPNIQLNANGLSANPLALNLGTTAYGMTSPTTAALTSGTSLLGDVADTGNQGLWSQFMQSMKDNGILTTTDKNGLTTQGIGNMALSAGTGLLNAYTGMQQLGLYKDQLNFQKDAFYKNWDANKSTVNSQLEDRQRARVASNSGAYESVSSYLA